MPQTNSNRRDIVILGGGHNGLVTAFYLAKAGFKPLVVERRAQVGGAAITDEFHPGFRCSTLAHTAGLRTGCITGRESGALLRRANEMHMEFIYMKQPLKVPAYEEILQKAGVSDSAVAFVGDDLPDIPLMRRAGLAIAVGNAVPEAKAAAHYITKALAGHGAIREAVELILKSKGIWREMIDKARA